MARIVAVHGIDNQYEGAHLLHAAWYPALRDGLGRAGTDCPDRSDFACVFWGDLFRPVGKGASEDWLAEQAPDEFEFALLKAWWEEAARSDEAVPSIDQYDSKGRTPQFVQSALRSLAQSRYFTHVAHRAMLGSLKQVRDYLHDDTMTR